MGPTSRQAGGWKYHSHAALAAAGFLYRRTVRCRWCGAKVALYGTPLGWTGSRHCVALNVTTFQQHAGECPGRPEAIEAARQQELFK